MKRNEDIFWGLLLVILAAYIIFNKLGWVGGINVWTIAFTLMFGSWFLSSIKKCDWSGICFSLAFLAIVYDDFLGIQELTPWPVLIAAFFLSLGLEKLFKKTPGFKFSFNGEETNAKWNRSKKEWEVYGEDGSVVYRSSMVDESEQDDEYFKCDVSFGSTIKYVSGQNLKAAKLDNSFGVLAVYFENANLYEGKAMVSVDNSFGKTTIYIPRTWMAHVDISKGFGNVKQTGYPTGESGNTLFIKGDCSFGEIEIKYC